MNTKLSMLVLLIMLAFPLFAQDYYEDEEELMTWSKFLWGVFGGAVVGGVGYAVAQVKPISGLGKVFMFLGFGWGALTLIVGVLQVLSIILVAAFGLAWKIAIVVLVIGIAYAVITGIVKWFKGNVN